MHVPWYERGVKILDKVGIFEIILILLRRFLTYLLYDYYIMIFNL